MYDWKFVLSPVVRWPKSLFFSNNSLEVQQQNELNQSQNQTIYSLLYGGTPVRCVVKIKTKIHKYNFILLYAPVKIVIAAAAAVILPTIQHLSNLKLKWERRREMRKENANGKILRLDT